jgi:O-antigen ligase
MAITAAAITPNREPALVKGRSFTPADVRLYGICDLLTGGLFCLAVIFSPWAFGTTEPWSVWTMNGCGYLLGLFLTIKIALRNLKAYQPPRWDPPRGLPSVPSFSGRVSLQRVLVFLTIGIVSYCVVSALNARSTFHAAELSFTYHSHLRWLPSSCDGSSSWFAFWTSLGFGCFFWAICDWLLGKSTREQAAAPVAGAGEFRELLPVRLHILLWLLAVNGALLGLEGLVQRLAGNGELLFFMKPRFNPEAITQFGPYAYRGNAAQYFNLLWPVCLGFWWSLSHLHKSRRKAHHLLLACAAIMAICPLASTSRGGALITIGLLLTTMTFLVVRHFLSATRRHENSAANGWALILILLFGFAVPAIGWVLGWKTLKPRLLQIQQDLQYREQMYAKAKPITADYPIFGTGPGTFENVFQLYRGSVDTYWPAQLHNDWLETRITFGWIGTILLAIAFLTVAARPFFPGGIPASGSFLFFVLLAFAGLLLHARFDFPFQVHSIVFLFLLLCSMLFTLSRDPISTHEK